MVSFTQSMAKFLSVFYPKEMALIGFGHLELFTEKMEQEYIDWCKTDEGKSYLKWGKNYNEGRDKIETKSDDGAPPA